MIHGRFHGKRWRRRRRKRRLRLSPEESRRLHIIIIIIIVAIVTRSRVGIRIVNYSSIEIVLVVPFVHGNMRSVSVMVSVGNAVLRGVRVSMEGVRGRSELSIVGREVLVIRVWRVSVESVIANEL